MSLDVRPGGISAMDTSVKNLSAAAAWAIYDYLLTFPDEVDYIWRKPWRSGSLLFLWVRYYGLATMVFKIAVTPSTVHAMSRLADKPPNTPPVAELMGFFLIFSVQVILQTRVYALYMSRPLGLFNGALFVAGMIASLALWGLSRPFSCKAEIFQSTAGCTTGYPTFWIPTIVFECWMGFLALYKFFDRMRGARPVPHGPDIVSVFLKDSAIHYVSVIVGVVIYNIIGGKGGAPGNSGFIQASMFIAGSRLVLHLRKAFYAQGQTQGVGFATETSNVSFRRGRRTTLSGIIDETFWVDDSPVLSKRHSFR